MFKIAICDDNKFDIRDISESLNSLKDEGIDIEISCYTNGEKLIDDFEKGIRYHMLILDMVMEPINGIDTAKELRKRDVSMPILIVTSTREFALDGYLVNAWRYITKPVDKEKFLADVRQILGDISRKDDVYFAINGDKGIVKIKIDDILYFDSNLHLITVHTIKETYTFRGMLTKIEEEFKNESFFRIHKSFLVNLRHVQGVIKLNVRMVNGEELPLSKMKTAALHEALLDYVSESMRKLRH